MAAAHPRQDATARRSRDAQRMAEIRAGGGETQAAGIGVRAMERLARSPMIGPDRTARSPEVRPNGPADLRRALLRSKCAGFVGAGFSRDAASLMQRSEHAAPHRPPVPLNEGGPRFARAALRCSNRRPVAETRSIRFAHCAQTSATSQSTKRFARPAILRSSAPSIRVTSGLCDAARQDRWGVHEMSSVALRVLRCSVLKGCFSNAAIARRERLHRG